MKEYLLSDIFAVLYILVTGELKTELYTRKRILIFLIFDQVSNS